MSDVRAVGPVVQPGAVERRRPLSGGPAPTPGPRPRSPPASVLRPRTWTLWTLRTPVVVYVLGVEVLAAAAAVRIAGAEPVSRADLPVLGLLVLGALVHQEVARAVERRTTHAELPRRVHVRLTVMWPFAALLLLPVGLVLVLVVVDFLSWGLRRPRRSAPFRCVFAAASVVLASTGAWLLLRLVPVDEALSGRGGPLTLGVIAAAVAVRGIVGFGLVAGLVAAVSPTSARRRRLGGVDDVLLVVGGLGLGVVLAAVATTRPWLAVFVLVPLAAMQYGLLLTPLAHAAGTDDKTGIADAEHWRRRAARALARAGPGTPVAVLMVDLDHFKAVNDTWGHLAGDRVLHAVAQALADAVRPRDLVGRFGGEEFAVLLVATDAGRAAATAERLRGAVGDLVVEIPPGSLPDDDGGPARGGSVRGGSVRGLSVSVGVAAHPGCGADLDALLVAADAACYRAKGAGRDRVRTAGVGE